MAKGSLRRYDVQAKISLYVSAAAALATLALLAVLMRNFRPEISTIPYGRGIYAPVVYLLTAGGVLLAATGAIMGAVSAGQKRNTLSKRSWAAFFVGGLSLSALCVLFYMFVEYGFRV